MSSNISEELNNFSLIELLDKTVTKNSFLGDHRSSLHPSSASVTVKGRYLDYNVGSCLRSVYYNMKDAPITNPSSAHLGRTAILGQKVEEYALDCFRDANILDSPTIFGSQVSLWDPELGLSGRLDAIIKMPDTGKLVIVEVKSYYGYYAKKEYVGSMKTIGGRKIKVLPQPKPSHLLQTAIYLYHFRDRIAGAKMLYIARDDDGASEFNLVLDKNPEGQYIVLVNGVAHDWFTVDSIYDRYRTLKKALADEIVPPRDYSLEYTKDELELLWKETQDATMGPGISLLTKGKYEEAQENLRKSGRTKAGTWNCGWCSRKDLCWKKDI